MASGIVVGGVEDRVFEERVAGFRACCHGVIPFISLFEPGSITQPGYLLMVQQEPRRQ
jgi:hypothetical protein